MGWLSRWFGKGNRAGQRALPALDLSVFRFDYHSHLVPGVDDGAPDLAASLDMVDGLVALGYEGAVTTPHIMAGTYPNDRSTLEPAFAALQAAVAERHPEFQLALGAEYFLDASLLERITNGGDLLAPGNHLLFELAFGAPPDDGLLREFLFEAQMRGLQPVMAHIERYPYWHGQLSRFGDLADQGVWLQVNAASLAGAYGQEVQQTADNCIDQGWVSILGSDAHGMRHIDALAAARTMPSLHTLAAQSQNPELW